MGSSATALDSPAKATLENGSAMGVPYILGDLTAGAVEVEELAVMNGVDVETVMDPGTLVKRVVGG